MRVFCALAVLAALLAPGSPAGATEGDTTGWFDHDSFICRNQWVEPPSPQPVELKASYPNGGSVTLWLSTDSPRVYEAQAQRTAEYDPKIAFALDTDYRTPAGSPDRIYANGIEFALGTSSDPADYDIVVDIERDDIGQTAETRLVGPVLAPSIGRQSPNGHFNPSDLENRCIYDRFETFQPGRTRAHRQVRDDDLALFTTTKGVEVCPGTYALVAYPTVGAFTTNLETEFIVEMWDSGTFPTITVLPSTDPNHGCGAAQCVDLDFDSAKTFTRCPDGSDPRPGWFHPLSPTRLFDTRDSAAPSGTVPPSGQLDIQVTGRAGVPTANVTAVAMNVTMANATAPGFVTVWPEGSERPTASSLNVIEPGQVVPNMVVVPVGPTGKVSFFTQGGGEILADVAGYFSSQFNAAGSRLVTVAPVRAFDTRTPEAPSGFVGAGGEITAKVTGVGDIPESGVRAVVVNITAAGAGGPGFVTAWPGNETRPNASNINLTRAGHTVPNLAFLPVAPDGTIRLFSQSGAHLLGDVTGYFTKATFDGAGTFVAASPARSLDTRSSRDIPQSLIDAFGLPQFVSAGRTQDAFTEDLIFGGAAALVNITATEAAAPGFVTAWEKDEPMPTTSVLNLTVPNETRANAALVPISDQRGLSLFSQSGTHVIVDTVGIFRN